MGLQYRQGGVLGALALTYSLHCSSFLGLPSRILYIELVKPKKGTTMETTGSSSDASTVEFRARDLT